MEEGDGGALLGEGEAEGLEFLNVGEGAVNLEREKVNMRVKRRRR